MSVYENDDIALFELAVESVYANTLLPDAFVLVIDGPVSKSMLCAIRGLQERYKLTVLPLHKNFGLAGALNFGLKVIHTAWVARADADDINVPDRFELQALAISDSGNSIDLIGGAIKEVEKSGEMVAIRRTTAKHDDIRRFAAHRNPFNHMTVVFRTDLAVNCGGYPDIHLKEDYALWAKMLSEGARSINLSNILVIATAGKKMYHRRGGRRYALAEIALQKHLFRTGLKSMPMAIVQGIARASIFLMPAIVRGWIYENVLRSRG
jgi:glycosyltransferase involved in cell wall biosynthesis